MPLSKSDATLRRGTACLSCRKRKLKCDGIRPVCRQCNKMNRRPECEYDDKQQKSRTQMLEEQLATLETRVHELESDPTGSGLLTSYHSDASNPSISHSPLNMNTPPWSDVASSSSSSSTHRTTPIRQNSKRTRDSGMGLEIHNPELYQIYSIPTAGSGMAQWDPRNPLPNEIRAFLLDIFMRHRHQCWFYGSMDRFFDLPNSQYYGEKPHPALTNAIYLLACHFGQSPQLTEIEPVFFTRTLLEINAALNASDRLIDIVQASGLLAVYLYTNSRTLEGYYHSFLATRLAIGIGLHQIRTIPIHPGTDQSPQTSTLAIPAPRDSLELAARISAFWQVFMVDRCWSIASGLPVALQDTHNAQTRIQTPWPRPPDELVLEETVSADPLQALFEGRPDPRFTSFYMPSLKAKAGALYELTSRLTTTSLRNDRFWADYLYAESAVQHFVSTVPPFGGHVASWETDPPIFVLDFFAVHTLIYTSIIHLQKSLFPDERTLRAATSILELIYQLGDRDYQYLDPLISACWFCVSRMFVRILANTGKTCGIYGDLVHISTQGLSVLTCAMKALSVSSPLSGDLAAKIELQMRLVH